MASMAMTEQQIRLVVAAQQGDVASFELLYDIYYQKAYSFAQMTLQIKRDTEDILQETFLAA
jgi:DNA-directed RNA polymerase specialized sigma24 family protein